MNKQVLDIVDEFKSSGNEISDEDVNKIYQLCLRKMKIAGVKDESYLPILFADELKNYAVRNAINLMSEMMKQLAEVVQNV